MNRTVLEQPSLIARVLLTATYAGVIANTPLIALLLMAKGDSATAALIPVAIAIAAWVCRHMMTEVWNMSRHELDVVPATLFAILCLVIWAHLLYVLIGLGHSIGPCMGSFYFR